MEPQIAANLSKIIHDVGIEIIKWILISSGGFIVTTIFLVYRMRKKLDKLLLDVKNISMGLRAFERRYGENHAEDILRYSDLNGRIEHAEGEINVLLKVFGPKTKNGHA